LIGLDTEDGARMAKAGDKQKAKNGSGTDRDAKGTEGDPHYKEEDLLRALNHVLRRQALRLLHSSKKPLSPVQVEAQLKLGEEVKEGLSQVSYHMKTLARLRVISLDDEEQVRGATKHFYVSNVSDIAWVRGLLKRMQKCDEAQLWPRGRG
jgi:DNA-binding transcriptional ArsR family regulator